MQENAHGYDNNDVGSKFHEFNFVVAGDFGCSDEANKTIDSMVSKKPEIVIALGDLAYKKNPQCWFDIISPLENISNFKISFGEHDVSHGNITYNNYLRHFNLTKPYYSFDYKNIHFIAMATAKNRLLPYNNTSDQYQFIKRDLIEADKNKNINWIVVYSFRPFYSSNTTHPGLDELQDLYHPLFEKYHVDLVLQGHNHNYQRTYPLSYDFTKQYTPIIADKNTESYRDIEDGPIFITIGTGGADFYNFTGQAPYVVKQLLLHGFLNVDVIENGSKLRLTFYENSGMVRDRTTIFKTKIS
ncbi:MAG: metallophosphoesterase [Thermoproteota archaeon]|nr:metallophosphoesterase [Thermoproteota archaeon]